MKVIIISTIILLSLFTTPVSAANVGLVQKEKQGLRHPKSLLTIDRMTPVQGHHKNTITLSNGVKYKIYPFHGWDLDHWKVGHRIRLEQSRDLLYKTKIVNLDVGDSISVKRKAALRP